MSTDPFIRVGIDIGGTFTDLQILDERHGTLHSLKTPTTPEDPSIGLLAGLEQAAAQFGFALPDIRLLLHGTTIATNAVLERRLARGVLLTTAGFEDVLEIGRHARRDIYAARQRRPAPLIPRDRRFGVPERMRADGTAERVLDHAALEPLAARIEAAGAEAVAVTLLHAYVNGAHEAMLGEWLARRFPGLPVSLSSDISPEIREYERSSTTVLNALLMPVVGHYLGQLSARLRAAGLRARLLLVQSNSGVCSPEVAARQPARLLLSGPSGGALATLRMAEALERPNLLGVDMGGTSFDVCVVREGAVTQMTQGEIDELPVRLPMIEIRTIGSGGGSIAAIDEAGRLRVGPRSAGSRPGPVCYGRGGTEPTVTDANLVMGRLDPRYFLGGRMALDLDGAREAIRARLGAPLGLGPEAAVEGMMTVTNTSLATAARLSLFEKGLDPRDFSLLSFGGAGGLHAIPVAEELGIGEVVFPADASTFSAYGILHSNIVHDLARSRVIPATAASLDFIGATLAELRARGAALLEEDGVPADQRRTAVSADLRYKGQASELVVPWPEAAADEEALARVLAAFHESHQARFSYANPDAPVELVALRLSATGLLPAGAIRRGEAAAAPPAAETRPVLLDGRWQPVAVHRRAAITGETSGPALIEEDYTTILLSAGWRCAPGPEGTLIARRMPQGDAA
ncbi:hydantoinase/oxoprolinase family protein [Teichococcus aestuarii]|uniref:5-oxoprolinase n=1 Tax=Teichococcus aestuarii TaxID=568898 RepID=A0A2U1UY94_9PROT|nr:hydantoinase/oxoprolinase family protein [Pseudoroseomonas aestuarii]PWC26626.1 5-oxoprolinase [Pseudoroseomonas aestuarii]